MRSLPTNAFSTTNITITTNGKSLITDQVIALSCQCVATGTLTGTLKLQASNDPQTLGNPTNWTDISGATVSVSSAATFLIPKLDISYEFVRAVFTASAGTGTLSAQFKTIGF